LKYKYRQLVLERLYLRDYRISDLPILDGLVVGNIVMSARENIVIT